MNCGEFVELVTAFLDGAMDEPTELRCLTHLAECDGCETYLDQFRQTVAVLGEQPAQSLPTEARDQLRGAFRALWRD
ncbi:zf-HC2 domain-containing protein [Streptomyces spinoverrucosus]|uniref:anti-sigma factor family protein n=1 Tax=Streptomyces spinoverrucosus TaxID=284043 RepID=UPI0018C372FB|nr:zf-HC2 domain-containing protein [Streptomyces spinoverrucosus]MBG0852169.1 zf-HC2 domain-containing protein [Streptomyces spinoverrucosus]